jgi:butyryl-CoA dehydrogenase
MSQRVIDITIAFLSEQKPFSGINISNQGVQWTLSKLLAQIEAGRWLVYRTASKMDKLESIQIQSAMNKLFATEIAMDTIRTCSRFLGENAFDHLSVFNRFMSVAKLLQIVDGTSEIQRMVIARDFEKRANKRN